MIQMIPDLRAVHVCMFDTPRGVLIDIAPLLFV
jgi:hypothetical protein